jgi:diguanylate cyclase (GGDEF)-like protein
MDTKDITFDLTLKEYKKTIKRLFLDNYFVKTRDTNTNDIVVIEKSFSKLIDSVIEGKIENSIKICEEITEHSVKINLPYVFLVHEFIQLHKIIVGVVLENYDKNSMLSIYNLQLIFEDVIAKNYLESYTVSLLAKNNVRINSLKDIYEKNIVQYYKSHLLWLSSLVKSVQDKKHPFPETNHTLCAFGQWLHSSGKDIIQNNSKYKEVEKQHQNLHLMATKIKSYMEKENVENHIILTYLEKAEMISLILGTELALIDNTLINSTSSKDTLTGALSRQKLAQLYTNQHEISFATSQPFVIAISDLDNFKRVNDTYGHLAGDKVLKGFVETAKKQMRNSDMIIRYGGEEFIFIFPAVSYEIGKKILEKIRVAFEEFEVEFEGNSIKTTVSIGMMALDSNDENLNLKDLEDAISIIDKKLYHAKNEGKNKIV